MLTMRPRPAARIGGVAACASQKAASTLARKIACQLDSAISSIGLPA
jgi:hypothetical protein